MRLAALLAVVFALISVPGIAAACGAFAAPPGPTDAELVSRLPYLTVEQVLLVWDKDTQTEDFIREARFAKSNQAFGFVVPTPTKPEIAAVTDAPFDRLRAKLPFEDVPLPIAGGGKGGPPGAVAAAAPAPPPVEVLAQQRIGSFTAFTLATTDASAFDTWLKDNGFAMSKEAKPWIQHYVRLKFFFVAFRYEPSDAGGDAMTSETVRIRFKTPTPYYPYMEPDHAANAPKPTKRLLTGWLVTREPMLAVAAKPSSRPRFGRPWTLGRRKSATSAELAAIFGPSLSAVVPASTTPLVVQPIRDQKISRARYGDIVLVPELPVTFSQADIDARRFLLGVVDPVVIGEQDQEPAAEDNPFRPAPAASVLPAPKPATCSVVPGPISGGFSSLFAFGALAACLVFRRRALLALALIGCRTPPTAPADAAATAPTMATAPTASVAPLSPADRERVALDVLAGKTPAEGIAENIPYDQGLTARVQLGPSLAIEGGALPTARKVLNAQIPRVRLCYSRDLEGNPAEHGDLTLVVTVNSNGSVASVQAMDELAFQPSLVHCVKNALSKATFDGAGGTVTVKPTYQLTVD